MIKAALCALVLAACGGGGKKPATPADQAPTDTAREAPPAEKPPEAKPPEPDNEAIAQAALAEQYELGKKVYADKDCDTCHGDKGEGNPKNPAVIGEKALPEKAAKTAKLRKGVAFKTAADVLGFVKAKMPMKTPGTTPGTLTDDEAAAVTAWILSESKVNVTKKLDAENAAAVNLR